MRRSDIIERLNEAELRRAVDFGKALDVIAGGSSARCMLIDDVTQIAQRVPFIECAPPGIFRDEPGLLSELAEACERLAVKVASLQEAQGADR